MFKKRLATPLGFLGIAMLYGSVVMGYAQDIYEDYVAAVSQGKNLGNISKAEEIQIGTPGDFDVSSVKRARKVIKAGVGTSDRNIRHSFKNVDDY